MALLRLCPLLTTLSLRHNKPFREIRDVDWFLRAFVEDGDHGVVCPHLQDFTFLGSIHFSFEMLRKFLEEKQRNPISLGLLPWRKVVIDINVKRSDQKPQQISDFVSQKRAEGLDIDVYIYSR